MSEATDNIYTKIYIERTINDAYLIIEEDDENCFRDRTQDLGYDFETRMLIENELIGILPLRIRQTEKGRQFMYSVRGSSPLSDKYENLTLDSKGLKMVIGGVQEGLSRLEEYMIETDHVILDPRYLFIDNTSSILKMCVYPYYEGNLREGLSKLADFIISKTNHNEDLAIDIAYGFYRQIMAGDYRFDELVELGTTQETNQKKIDNGNNSVGRIIPTNTTGKDEEIRLSYEPPKPSTKQDNAVGKSILGLLVFAAVVFCLALCFLLLYFGR